MANSKKRRRIIVFAGIGLVVVGLTLWAVLNKREAVITIQTEKAALRNITELVVANGKIQPAVQVVISPEVAGEIVALPVKEGDVVKKGSLLVQIKPDNYMASSNSAVAMYKSATAGRNVAQAELEKAKTEYDRNKRLFDNNLVSESIFLDFKTAYDVAKLRYENAIHSEAQARFGLDKASDDLSKTTILAPMDGTVTRLRSQLGERVLGTSFNMGTEIMTIADLNVMEARVDIGEMDVVLIAPGQITRLEVDAFKDRKFSGTVTEIANSSKTSGFGGMGGGGGGGNQQEATKFEVKIRIKEKELFRPGMSVNAEIETRYRTNVLTVPIASVTTRLPKEKKEKTDSTTNPLVSSASASTSTNSSSTNSASTNSTAKADKKSKEGAKPIEVVFISNGERAKMVPVKIGISDESYWEITEGLKEGDEVVSGGYRAIGKDLEDGKKIRKGLVTEETDKAKEKK
jgi:HlyD family secretion protein